MPLGTNNITRNFCNSLRSSAVFHLKAYHHIFSFIYYSMGISSKEKRPPKGPPQSIN